MIPPKQGHAAHGYIDAARALAALAVVWHHSGYDFIGAQGGSALGSLFTFSISLGHQAVVIFFVLSGYLVGSSWMKWKDRPQGKLQYAIDRLTRLETALIPALVLTAILDGIGYYLVQPPTAYRGALNYLDAMWPDFRYHYQATVFAGNVVFLQYRVGTFGSNSALWSLAYEFFYYCLFPLTYVFAAFKARTVWQKRLLAGVIAVPIALLAGDQIILSFSLWLLGAALYFIKPWRFASTRQFFWLATAIFAASVLSSLKVEGLAAHLPGRLRSVAGDLPLAVCFTLWLYAVLNQPDHVLGKAFLWFGSNFAKFSYTLYLVHLPIVILIHSAFLKDHRWPLSATSVAGLVAVDSVCVVAAYGMWYLFESRTSRVRDAVKKRLGLGARLPS